MAAEKEVKRLKYIEGSRSVWIGLKVYWLNFDNKVEIAAGGVAEEEDIIRAEKYFKSKKLL